MTLAMPFTSIVEAKELLRTRILDFVKTIPRGKVVSYGQIGVRFGIQDARIIGYTMHSVGANDGVPWWRVINNEGRLTIKDEATRQKHKSLLMAEGIYVNDNFAVDIEKYRYGSMPGQKRLI